MIYQVHIPGEDESRLSSSYVFGLRKEAKIEARRQAKRRGWKVVSLSHERKAETGETAEGYYGKSVIVIEELDFLHLDFVERK